MIGSKAVASGALLVVIVVVGLTGLHPSRVSWFDEATLFWSGLFAVLAGTLIVRFWRLHRRSHGSFRYSYGERTWDHEADFVAIGKHRISVSENDGTAYDLPPSWQYGIYIALAFQVSLLAIDSRAIDLVSEFPRKATLSGSQFCPEPKETGRRDRIEKPGCALVRRAYALGYAKSLGACSDATEESEAEICMRRHRDEPALHYAWRQWVSFVTELRGFSLRREAEVLRQSLTAKLEHVEALYHVQKSIIGTAARASHHIWISLPDPRGAATERLAHALRPGRCEALYHRLAHRPSVHGDPGVAPSVMVDHILGKLLFEPRYMEPSGHCREYAIHWNAPANACIRLSEDPRSFLRESGALASVLGVVDRFERRRRLAQMGGAALGEHAQAFIGRAAAGFEQESLQRVVSFSCYGEGVLGDGARQTYEVSLAGYPLIAAELMASVPDDPEAAYVARYHHLAKLLAGGFRYGALMSIAALGPYDEATDSEGEAADLFAEPSLRMSRLDLLSGTDVFLGDDWVLRRDALRELYPYHLHLKNFVGVFRRQYQTERGRL